MSITLACRDIKAAKPTNITLMSGGRWVNFPIKVTPKTMLKAKMAEVDSMMKPPCGPTRTFIKKGTVNRHNKAAMANTWPNDLR